MATDNIILEHLRAIRAKVDRIDQTVLDLKEEMSSFRLREHARDADNLRHDRQITQLREDVDQIKRRLELVGDET